jgi:hypothetical protein
MRYLLGTSPCLRWEAFLNRTEYFRASCGRVGRIEKGLPLRSVNEMIESSLRQFMAKVRIGR